jgi:uncharacterized protein YdhG (YjbR/CyaY superfamily)
MMPRPKPATIAEYIAAAPKEARQNLRALYAILRKVAPGATEAIKWRLPVFEENRILFAFAAYKLHLNFMPTSSAMKPFREQLSKFKTGKGSIQIPHDKPLPGALIRRIAAFRVRELREKDVKWM